MDPQGPESGFRKQEIWKSESVGSVELVKLGNGRREEEGSGGSRTFFWFSTLCWRNGA